MHGVTSSPYLIDPVQFGLNDDVKNKQRLKELKKLPAKVLGSYNNHDLTEYRKSANESFIVLEAEDEIAYFVHCVDAHFKQFGARAITQVEVWRASGRATLVGGLTKYVFWKILLPVHKRIVSDRSQTQEGKRFWLDRMDEAREHGCRIGVFDQDEPTVEWAPKDAVGAWLRLTAQAMWGTDNEHWFKRFVIQKD